MTRTGPAPVRARALRPGLHLLETEVEAFDVRAAVLIGTRRAVVWDTLAHPAQMAPVASLAEGLPVTVVYSHADWDHVWGTCGLAGGEAPGRPGGVEAVLACEATAERFRGGVQADLARRRADAPPGSLDAVRLVPPSTTFVGSTRVDLGGATLHLHALPGHTEDCLVGFVPEWGALLAGDAVETPLPFVNEGAAVPEWIEGLERWAADARVTTVVPSHGPVGGRELIEETAAYLRSLVDGSARAGSRRGEDLSSLSPFYVRTHARNLERVQGIQG